MDFLDFVNTLLLIFSFLFFLHICSFICFLQYLKTGKVKEAIDCCVQLNEWDQAIDLAQKHNIKEIDNLLAKYASYLLDKKKTLDAIELYPFNQVHAPFRLHCPSYASHP